MRLNIAVIEDDEDDREFINGALAATLVEMNVISYSTGYDFISSLTSDKLLPDVIMTDLRMPLVTGFDVIAAIKKEDRTKNIPVVVFSTSSNTEDIRRATKLGASAYFVKPFRLSEFREVVSRIVASFPNADKS